jgi:glutamine amidotransferase-like uncharacterized protein
MVVEAGIYVGAGASHSWTWFADIFDRYGFYAVRFIDEAAVKAGALNDFQVLFISGGDTFAIADGLGQEGAGQLHSFITRGGVYIGSCAGAYLPLNSSLPPLNLFNFVSSRITNLTKNLPAPKQMAEKFCTEYGCQYVFHPVRDAVKVRIAKEASPYKDREITAPLFGGPCMTESDDIEILATYSGFTERTEFLVDESIAGQTLLGTVAAARKQYGKGMLYVLGPHFEHPYFHEANKFLFDIMVQRSASPSPIKQYNDRTYHYSHALEKLARIFRSEISNARITALALERVPYQWLIGKKVYDPEKIRVLIESIWSRVAILKQGDVLRGIEEQELEELVKIAQLGTAALRRLRNDTEKGENSNDVAEKLFTQLKSLAARFLSLYFRLQQEHYLLHCIKTERSSHGMSPAVNYQGGPL